MFTSTALDRIPIHQPLLSIGVGGVPSCSERVVDAVSLALSSRPAAAVGAGWLTGLGDSPHRPRLEQVLSAAAAARQVTRAADRCVARRAVLDCGGMGSAQSGPRSAGPGSVSGQWPVVSGKGLVVGGHWSLELGCLSLVAGC